MAAQSKENIFLSAIQYWLKLSLKCLSAKSLENVFHSHIFCIICLKIHLHKQGHKSKAEDDEEKKQQQINANQQKNEKTAIDKPTNKIEQPIINKQRKKMQTRDTADEFPVQIIWKLTMEREKGLSWVSEKKKW